MGEHRDNKLSWVIFACLAVVLLTAAVEAWMGRSVWGPDGRFGLWEGNIWSQECSQRLLDPYSFSHVCHGILFYGLLWAVGRRASIPTRFTVAVLLEAGWEMLENSPIIINRYRQETMALGYDGDSILNSASDILMMMIGFLLALRLRPWMTVMVLVAMEVGCLFWIRDNLTLNVIMLIHPVKAIKAWQMALRPPG